MSQDTTSIRIAMITHRRINDFKTQASFVGTEPTIDDVLDKALDLLFAQHQFSDRAKEHMMAAGDANA